MKKQNNDDIIMHRHPFGMTNQQKRSARRITNCEGGAGETGPIIARLRAKAYRYRKRKTRLAEGPTKWAGGSSQHARGLLDLGRQYDVQARDNFAKEAILFCVIIVVAVAWPAILSLRVLAG
jgi:hypothetical protein